MGKKYLVTVEEQSGCGAFLVLLAVLVFGVVIGLSRNGSNSGTSTPNSSQPPAEEPRRESSDQSGQSAAGPSSDTPTVYWGAFAVSPGTSRSSWATGYISETEASQEAIRQCGESDCEAFSTFNSGYAVLAESDKGWFSVFGMSSQAEAEQNALSQCEQKDPGENCRITHSVHF